MYIFIYIYICIYTYIRWHIDASTLHTRSFLHNLKLGMIHRDVKPANVMITFDSHTSIRSCH